MTLRPLWAMALFVVTTMATMACTVSIPEPSYPVLDTVGVLDTGTRQRIVRKISSLEAATSAEIGVLVLPTTKGEKHADYALRVFNSWGVGKAGANNGVLLLFAMEDRRVELVPGTGYKALFPESTTSDFVENRVVAKMRAGQRAGAIESLVDGVVERIRAHEIDGIQQGDTFREAPTNAFNGGTSQFGVAHGRAAPRGTGPLTINGWLLVGLLLFFGLLYWVIKRIHKTGKLIVPVFALWTILLGGLGLLGFMYFTWVARYGTPDIVAAVAALFGIGFTTYHIRRICPKCNRNMSLSSVTLRSATTYSAGTGERTEHCGHCGHHLVTTYTIPRVSETSSSSSSSSSSFGGSSGGSFGGGSSSGGGGGASW